MSGRADRIPSPTDSQSGVQTKPKAENVSGPAGPIIHDTYWPRNIANCMALENAKPGPSHLIFTGPEQFLLAFGQRASAKGLSRLGGPFQY